NVGFTAEPGEPDNAGFSDPIASAWWVWTAPSDGITAVSLAGSDFLTTLGVYTGASVDALTTVAENFDFTGAGAQLTFPTVAASTYYFSVAGPLADQGNINLSLAPFTPVGNDMLPDPFTPPCPFAAPSGTNVGFTAEPGEPSNAGDSAPITSAWWV